MIWHVFRVVWLLSINKALLQIRQYSLAFYPIEYHLSGCWLFTKFCTDTTTLLHFHSICSVVHKLQQMTMKQRKRHRGTLSRCHVFSLSHCRVLQVFHHEPASLIVYAIEFHTNPTRSSKVLPMWKKKWSTNYRFLFYIILTRHIKFSMSVPFFRNFMQANT